MSSSANSGRILIYGATGFTGRLTTDYAAQRGLDPIVAGRTKSKVMELSEAYGFDGRWFDLDYPTRLRNALEGVSVVLNIAGPFSRTAALMAAACVDTGAHYIDVVGSGISEIEAIEKVVGMDRRAQKAGVTLVPAGGLESVATECLAYHVAQRAHDPKALRIAIASRSRSGRGSVLSNLDSFGKGVPIRRDGRMVSLKPGSVFRDFDFGMGPQPCVIFAGTDISVAWRSTGIPDVEIYFPSSGPALNMMRTDRYLGWLLKRPGMHRRFEKFATRNLPDGLPPEEMDGSTFLYLAEVEQADGRVLRSRLKTDHGYRFTARAALEGAVRLARNQALPGFQTPALAFGVDFPLDPFLGATREDLPDLE